MRIASHKTLRNHTRTRSRYAYNAIERECLIHDTDSEEFEKADQAMDDFENNKLSKAQELDWALRRQEYMHLTD